MRPCVAITMGDIAGIGPDLICKVLADPKVYEACKPVVVGSAAPLRLALEATGKALEINIIEEPAQGRYCHGAIDLIDLPVNYQWEPGVMKAENGQIAIDYMKYAHQLVVAGKADAIANAPSNKEAMHMAGSPYTGATELFAALGNVDHAYTTTKQGPCYLFQATTHLSLRDALNSITQELIFNVIKHAYETIRGFGIEDPLIGLCAINPHAGENGLMGREEIDILIPAVKAAQEEGIRVVGPLGSDSAFLVAQNNHYDGLIGMFHDTMGAVTKLAATTTPTAVITSGLPFIRTTVAHGTGYDIAYQNKADAMGLHAAVLTAAEIASAKMKQA